MNSTKRQIRAVVDTNIVYSGLEYSGFPYRVVDAGMEGRFVWVYSDDILYEYEQVMAKKGLSGKYALLLPEIYKHGMNVTVPGFLADTFTDIKDPEDRPIFAAAYAARALFVTGDKGHFPWQFHAGVRILSPKDFYAML